MISALTKRRIGRFSLVRCFNIWCVAALLFFGGHLLQGEPNAADPGQGVQIVPLINNTLRVNIGGQLFTVYHYNDVPRPYFYPVLGPDELPMTRKWPMEETTDEEHDHPHHRGLWFAHGSINGLDFWSEEKNF